MQVDLSIIFVNWNGGALLSRAVDSLLAFPPSVEYEVIVVDNASTDDSLAQLRSTAAGQLLEGRGRLRFIQNPENRGFGPANNQAFDMTSTPLLLLINPDATVTAGCVDGLIQAVRTEARVAAVGPRILNSDGSLQISVWRNPPAAWNIVLSNLKLYSLLPKRLRGELLLGGHWQHDCKKSVPMLSGASILVRREVIDSVGGFDERFHMYGEDHEWCLRIKRAGWSLIFEPDAVVVHQGGWSSLQRWTDLETIKVRLESQYMFQKQVLSRSQLTANFVAYCVTESVQHLWRRVRKVDAPDVKFMAETYWEHLKRTLRNGDSTDNYDTH